MRKLKGLALVGLLALAGCQGANGSKYIGLPGSPAWFMTASPETVAGYFSDRCVSYGFQRGTPQMAQCIQTEAQGARGRNAMRGAAMAAAANQPRHATCTGIGNTVNCTSY
jgi:hypothetical protein